MSPDIPDFLARGCLTRRNQPPWSSFYAVRMAALQRARADTATEAAQDDRQPPTWADMASECGADAADALDVLRDAWERGRYPDDMCASFNAHRLTFARWLVRQGYLTP